MKGFARGIFAASIILSLAGCKTTNVQTYNGIDNSNRTITVPADNSALIGAIKQRLQRIGWQLTVEDDGTQPVGTVAATRYRLQITQSQVDTCYPKGTAEVNFRFTLVDNKTRDAVLVGNGRDCSDVAAAKIVAAVRDAGRRR